MASVDMCEHDWPGSGCKECAERFSSEDGLDAALERDWPQGRSVGAAAYALCRTLGAGRKHPLLKEMLESFLASANRASLDRSIILRDFTEASPEAAMHSRLESFERTNRVEDKHPRELPAAPTAQKTERPS